MNETFKKILTYVVIGILVLYGCFSTVNWTRTHFQLRRTEQSLEQCMGELRYCREQYERADEIQRNIEDTVRDANTTIQRQHDSLCISVDTIGELRRSFEEVEQYCHSLENYIDSINSEFSRNDNDTDNSAVQQVEKLSTN